MKRSRYDIGFGAIFAFFTIGLSSGKGVIGNEERTKNYRTPIEQLSKNYRRTNEELSKNSARKLPVNC